MMNKVYHGKLLALTSFILGAAVFSTSASALTYSIPAKSDVVGEVRTAVAKHGDTLAQIARDNDMGFTELEEGNPGLDPDRIVPGTVVMIPTKFVLPNSPRDGIVINLAEMRLYYYPKGGNQVTTFPIGIGREGEDTPVGILKVVEHIRNPTWYSPESVRKLRAAEGVVIPKMVPPGPDNPLGNYAMRLSNMTYLIHGTNDPLGGIGRRSSAGCIRLYPEDIEKLFGMVSNGTKVHIVDQTYKAGWLAGNLLLESHVALQNKTDQVKEDENQIRSVIQLAIKDKQAQVDWDKALEISGETQGFPQTIGHSV